MVRGAGCRMAHIAVIELCMAFGFKGKLVDASTDISCLSHLLKHAFYRLCGLSDLHTQPQATKNDFSANNMYTLTCILVENGVRFITNVLRPGIAFVFAKGAILFETNFDCGESRSQSLGQDVINPTSCRTSYVRCHA
jgi:hypothetical protein